MKLKNKNAPNTNPCVTPEYIFLNSEVSPFKTTLSFTFFKLSFQQRN